MSELVRTWYRTEIGFLEIAGSEAGIAEVRFCETEPAVMSDTVPTPLVECVCQLDEYFRGERNEFTLTLLPEGTPFQQQVWNELLKIPFGVTTSYSEIATQVENPRAVRAVGHANGQNPIWIIIPCHRVIGKNGKLTGYGGGLWRKKWLLEHEAK